MGLRFWSVGLSLIIFHGKMGISWRYLAFNHENMKITRLPCGYWSVYMLPVRVCCASCTTRQIDPGGLTTLFILIINYLAHMLHVWYIYTYIYLQNWVILGQIWVDIPAPWRIYGNPQSLLIESGKKWLRILAGQMLNPETRIFVEKIRSLQVYFGKRQDPKCQCIFWDEHALDRSHALRFYFFRLHEFAMQPTKSQTFSRDPTNHQLQFHQIWSGKKGFKNKMVNIGI